MILSFWVSHWMGFDAWLLKVQDSPDEGEKI